MKVSKTKWRQIYVQRLLFLFKLWCMKSHTVITKSPIRICRDFFFLQEEITVLTNEGGPAYYKSHSFGVQKITWATEEKVSSRCCYVAFLMWIFFFDFVAE